MSSPAWRTAATTCAVAAALAGCAQQATPPPAEDTSMAVTVIAEDLAVPWDVDFLPSGEALVTERDAGRVLQLGDGGAAFELAAIPEVDNSGEGGLMGIAVSPDFAEDNHVFVYYTTAADNRIVRYTYEHTRPALTAPQPVLTGIPAARIHNGGALTFGPDSYLYASTGDATEQQSAQDPESLAGKILRMTADGEPASGNPGDSVVWSLGHRNVQGLAFDSQNRLWASEFGASAWDELNLIEPGANYGWPEVEGIGDDDRFVDPAHVWRPAEASPAGLAIVDDVLYMAALRGNRLWEIPITDAATGATGEPRSFLGEYGRLRAAVTGPDGELWVSTSNRDGRGRPEPGDDRIVSVRPG
ncbi:PQQ-dependent sugar dehydrogenase [Hoyosella sp. YIM 151337]|uniref:PQQ-dependent sugar dehydrogenase n=1 Tax=Hoyosella sp. YIM 151337 TaxID=2992742 RepID=UPI0022362C30|nr:PQQ-dependent sugar dehydrogenase [Hoyosella sp. YIM 151337]MCW4352189.1 PQQ-dependent sugar dehydrogenase [Hoyosella sp. YIM 151337]